MLIKVQEQQAVPDVEFMCRCFVFLKDAPAVSAVLNRLLGGSQVRLAVAELGVPKSA